MVASDFASTPGQGDLVFIATPQIAQELLGNYRQDLVRTDGVGDSKPLIRQAAIPVFCVAAATVFGFGAQKPDRLVKGTVITSGSNPRVRIQLPREAEYLGADRWVLYDVADCEVYVFVEADAKSVVQRFYWIQFEGYIPSRPELKYDYTSNPLERISGMDFHVRARFGPTDDSVRAGSDTEHVRHMIRKAGYKMPAGMMNVRLVHLTDPRRELMIIYGENTAAAGVDWTDLQPGGRAAEQWAGLQKGLLERAQKRIVIQGAGGR